MVYIFSVAIKGINRLYYGLFSEVAMAPSDYLSLLSHYAWPLIGSFSLVFLTWTLYRLFSPFRKLPYPPGPPAQSLLWGNLSDYPTAFAWRVYIEWGEKYGACSSLPEARCSGSYFDHPLR